MSKKNLPGPTLGDDSWQEQEEPDTQDPGLGDPPAAKAASRTPNGKPSRQRIEEYFERKRLAEALQEDLGDDIFGSGRR